MILNVLHMSWL